MGRSSGLLMQALTQIVKRTWDELQLSKNLRDSFKSTHMFNWVDNLSYINKSFGWWIFLSSFTHSDFVFGFSIAVVRKTGNLLQRARVVLSIFSKISYAVVLQEATQTIKALQHKRSVNNAVPMLDLDSFWPKVFKLFLFFAFWPWIQYFIFCIYVFMVRK